jgi:hypothetical protein
VVFSKIVESVLTSASHSHLFITPVFRAAVIPGSMDEFVMREAYPVEFDVVPVDRAQVPFAAVTPKAVKWLVVLFCTVPPFAFAR